MKGNKHIERDENATKIFDNRSLAKDYRNLIQILEPGMTVLDVGCGTGSISKDIANYIGKNGKVIRILIILKTLSKADKNPIILLPI